MKQQKGKRLQALVRLLDIPQDIILDLPRLTMLGNQQLLIENHKGIIEYTPSLIRIKINQGELIVEGVDLTLGNLQVEQILIEGIMRYIKYDT